MFQGVRGAPLQATQLILRTPHSLWLLHCPSPFSALLCTAPALLFQLPARYLHKDTSADDPGGESFLVIHQPLALPELLVQLTVGVFEQEADRAPDDVHDILAADQEEGQQHHDNQQLGQEAPHSAHAGLRVCPTGPEPAAQTPAMLPGWDGQSPLCRSCLRVCSVPRLGGRAAVTLAAADQLAGAGEGSRQVGCPLRSQFLSKSWGWGCNSTTRPQPGSDRHSPVPRPRQPARTLPTTCLAGCSPRAAGNPLPRDKRSSRWEPGVGAAAEAAHGTAELCCCRAAAAPKSSHSAGTALPALPLYLPAPHSCGRVPTTLPGPHTSSISGLSRLSGPAARADTQ